MNFKSVIICCVILFSSSIFAQDDTFAMSGTVNDSLQKPLARVTLIAKPKKEEVNISYAITDDNGNYQLRLKKGIFYELLISHLGYNSIKREVLFSENILNYDFVLNTKYESLDEVVINYKYQPIKKNKDTITYNLRALTNGNEFKMKDVLDKLPGIRIDENVIKVQGKTVTKLLVDGKSFFDGSTRLAIENIPADVMDKIEIISDYKESELLRNLADNEDLALNVVLKKDKKDFAFGDIDAGVGFDEFYRLRSSLFKYSSKSNISFIGDINNFNKSSLSFRDLLRLVGGSSNLFGKNDLSNNLLNFASNNSERYRSTNRFSAINFQRNFNNRFNLTGYAIYSNNDITDKSSSIREYFSDDSIFETRDDFKDTDDSSAIFNLKFDYNPSITQKWIYNISYLHNTSGYIRETLSNSENQNQFITNVDYKNDNFSHNLEGYLKLNDKHTVGLAFYHGITDLNSTNNWNSDTIFLEEFLPLIETANYQIKQKSVISSQIINLLLKDYWLANKYYHIFFNIGFNYKNSKIKSDLSQIFADNSSIDFSEISNNNLIILSDLNFGLGIKSRLGKFEFILEAKPHYYRFNRAQIETNNLFVVPKFNVNYKIDDDIDFDFGYEFVNKYLNDLDYLENLRVTGFNSLIQGNPNLIDERSHNFALYYSNYKKIEDYFIDASIDYSIINPVKNNSIVQNGINQLNVPVLLNLPENNLNVSTQFGLIFNKSSLEFGINLDWLKINQIINEEVNNINSFEYNLSSKLLLKLSNKTQLNLEYKHSRYQVDSDEDSSSTENIFSLNFDSKLLKNFIFKTDLSTNIVNDFSDKTRDYTLQNLYLGYSRVNSRFSYGINFRNIYNNGIIIRNSFRNNLLSSERVFTLPRVFLVELKYSF